MREKKYFKRYFKGHWSSYFLFGPRGTGKSTWLKKNCPQAFFIDLLQPDIFRRYKARPERLREIVLGNPDKRIIVLDEIQKAPELLDVVHFLLERDHSLQFIMTGSSARKIKQKEVDLLAGRAAIMNLHPYMAAELDEAFNLSQSLRIGLIPLIMASSDPEDSLNAYISLYMKEEVQMEGLVRKIGGFARFLEAISFSHGAVLNVSNVARECEVKRKTVQAFIEILFDLLMAFSLPVFSKRAQRAVVQHPKFYFFDTGVFRALRPSGPLDRPEEIEGAAIEGLVAQHLKAWIDYNKGRFDLYYWRTKAGTEVDFILYGSDGFWAIEVKNTGKVRKSDLRPLKSFHQDYPECTPIFLYRGDERLLVDGIFCIPCESFLKNLRPDTLPGMP